MRTWKTALPAVSVCLVLLAAAGCGGGQSDATQTPAETATHHETAAMTETASETTPAETAPSGPTATLTHIVDGVTKTKDVPYLPPGRKIATMETTKGVVKLELWEDKTPNTVINFVSLANAGRYDGVDFHRVIDGFMAQTGDVEKQGGYGGPGYTIPAEFDASRKHVRGVVSMARSSDPNSAGSQFFIMFAAAPNLDGQYAAFGQVIEGMDVIDAIKKGDRAQNGSVTDPDKIVRLRVESAPAE
jgi:cyclophilin family peptidyl-prolyl cis-trans isomerase